MITAKRIAPIVLLKQKRDELTSKPFDKREFLTLKKLMEESGIENCLARFSEDCQRLGFDELEELMYRR